ncbi:Peptidase M43, pregnancy-associated plasma-A [Akanthomyces lecanii RCEF 1005]|uniref:Peptidase M43, pregnancy-associated plasma-A n=1 Tax=Akanthomyces lecanii RCEF 1005 TaxID=1081108 RepID=A0A168AYJ9_CORDF|nr:Peptidase M43, pregnancy-associated plasma-A [Akanthomyces lecanii RCEF 1005]
MHFTILALLAFSYNFVCIGAARFTVPVHFSVFHDQNNQADGNFPDGVLQQQMQVLNSFTQQIGLTFQIASVRRIPVPYNVLHGSHAGNNVERILKQYRQGNVQALNIYTVGSNPNGGSTSATFPKDYNSDPRNDGIVIDYGFLPGGRYSGYNTGKALVREVGHWAGLFNTYDGGCGGNGDGVDDTPAELPGASGCPTGRDSCPNKPGVDPIHNMMDSTDE